MASVLRSALDEYFPEELGVRIIAEPGRYFVESAFTLVANVIAKRTVTSQSASSSQGNIDIVLMLPQLSGSKASKMTNKN